jgi:hypothetical protein
MLSVASVQFIKIGIIKYHSTSIIDIACHFR